MLIGYMRVSRDDGVQKLDMQKDALLKAGVQEEYIYSDMASGSRNDRSGLEECLRSLRDGDILVVYALDRIARSVKHASILAESLGKKNIGIKVLSGAGSLVDVTTVHGKFAYNMLAALAELELELTKERTKAGLAAARSRGKLGGRKRKVTKAMLQVIQLAMRDSITSVKELADQLKISKFSIYHYVYANGELTKHGKQLMGDDNESI